MKQSEMQRQAGSTGSSIRTALHASAGQAQEGPQAAGHSPTAGRRLEIIDRNAEEALQIQVGWWDCMRKLSSLTQVIARYA